MDNNHIEVNNWGWEGWKLNWSQNLSQTNKTNTCRRIKVLQTYRTKGQGEQTIRQNKGNTKQRLHGWKERGIEPLLQTSRLSFTGVSSEWHFIETASEAWPILAWALTGMANRMARAGLKAGPGNLWYSFNQPPQSHQHHTQLSTLCIHPALILHSPPL